MTLYLQPHQGQYQDGVSAVTRHSGCTWTSGANGAAATTGGARRPTPDQVHALLPSGQETSPGTPGWSIPDLVRAMAAYGVPVEDLSGHGWAAVEATHDSGRYIVLQGVSAAFDGTSCSGTYDGDHAIGVHPRSKLEAGVAWWWVDDPVCSTGRWERETVLRKYAEALWSSVRFAAFTAHVPALPAPKPPAPPVTLRFQGRKLAKPVAKRIRVARGRLANVRTAPRTTGTIAQRLAAGKSFTAYQVTDRGQLLAGSARWWGDRTGTRWVHSSSF